MMVKIWFDEAYPTLKDSFGTDHDYGPQPSEVLMVQIGKPQHPLNGEFTEFFKTHPTLICRLIFKASRILQTKLAMLSDRVCTFV